MNVSVLTASLPERADMLVEAVASVKAQTVAPIEHLVGVDFARIGAGPVLNALLWEAKGDWVMVLDDDDLIHPGHLEALAHATTDADVVYSMPVVEGGTFHQYEEPFDREVLEHKNIVSHNALMRTDLVRSIDGWESVRWFDWDLFRRLSSAGARFHKVEMVTWTYRLTGSNWSQGTLVTP